MNQQIVKSIRSNQIFQMILSLLLILMGIVFLIKEIRLNMVWSYLSTGLIILFGLYFLLDFLWYQTQKSILPGLILCIFGIFMFLNHIQILLFRDLMFPLFLLTFGIALLVYYLVSSEKVYMWCSYVLLLVSIIQILNQTGALEGNLIQKYWPIGLILVGILLLVNYQKRK
jgi:hypothetical protein